MRIYPNIADHPNREFLERRVLSHILIDEACECWLWQGRLSVGGYGIIGIDGKKYYAHRVVFLWKGGRIPEGLDLDHLCRVRNCVNPKHLEPVTRRENLMRGETIPAKRAAKTQCSNGHPLDKFNTYLYKGKRDCRICIQRRNRARRKA